MIDPENTGAGQALWWGLSGRGEERRNDRHAWGDLEGKLGEKKRDAKDIRLRDWKATDLTFNPGPSHLTLRLAQTAIPPTCPWRRKRNR